MQRKEITITENILPEEQSEIWADVTRTVTQDMLDEGISDKEIDSPSGVPATSIWVNQEMFEKIIDQMDAEMADKKNDSPFASYEISKSKKFDFIEPVQEAVIQTPPVQDDLAQEESEQPLFASSRSPSAMYPLQSPKAPVQPEEPLGKNIHKKRSWKSCCNIS